MFELMMYLKVFLVGGFICALGQILIITTNMKSARILLSFLILGVALQVFNLFEPLKEFAGAGVTIPIVGFGASLAKGAVDGLNENGVLGLISGGLEATSAGIAVAIVSAFIFALIFSSKTKK